jgi:glycosyltransferase involved in cell wall biosynthesis
MAVGTPVVTTARLAAAIGATPGVHLLTAEDPASTAAATVAVLGDPALAARLREAAERFVGEGFGWDRAAASVAAVWQRAIRSEP